MEKFYIGDLIYSKKYGYCESFIKFNISNFINLVPLQDGFEVLCGNIGDFTKI